MELKSRYIEKKSRKIKRYMFKGQRRRKIILKAIVKNSDKLQIGKE